MKNFSNLSSDQILKIKIKLENEKTQNVLRLKELLLQDPFSDPERVNDNASQDTDASEEANHDRVSALTDEVKAQITAIDIALVKIENGIYGVCEKCGQNIDPKRLEIFPSVGFCIGCQNQICPTYSGLQPRRGEKAD